jgi:UDP-hydrolysing UDP-N-acetyl-D-glucosamine 2-epimerase
MKRILAITGKRGGYEAMLPLLGSLRKSPQIDTAIFCIDQHWMEKFGSTIKKMGPGQLGCAPIALGDSARDRCLNLGHYVSEIASHLYIHKPDLLILYGDRGEVAAAALSAATLGIPVAHLQAGDITGNVDDIYRGMISQSANLLFTSCGGYKEDLLRKGHSEERIFVTGDQHLDAVQNRGTMDKKEVCERLGVPERSAIGIIIVHPDTSEPGGNEVMIENVLCACTSHSHMQWFAVYPCSDPGHDIIIDALHKYSARVKNLSVHANIQAEVFHNLLFHSELIVGNSSCGIIEAPFLSTPSLDIGGRQHGRVRSPSIHWASGHKYFHINNGVERCIRYDGTYRKDFGDGEAYIRIGEIILDSLLGHLKWLLEPKMDYE